jgi:hypothetical protein
MEQLNTFHESKLKIYYHKCEKTNNQIPIHSYEYDNETTPILVNAIKELQQRINSLENELAKYGGSVIQPQTTTVQPLPMKKKPLNLY